MDNSPFFSVIVPVYNVSQYLRRCIDSVLSQSYGDFELLLVDDGSSDDSGVICDEYAEKDGRIKVFHKENGGVSSARNKGIDEACGKYIIFVDSDDYIWPERLQRMASVSEHNPDMIVEDYGVPEEYRYKFKKIERQDFYYVNKICVIWTSAFKNDIIQKNHIRYDETIWHGEDSIFILNYFYYCNTIIFADGYGYVYDKGHENGLSVKFQSWEKEFYVYTKIKNLRQKITDKYCISFQEKIYMNIGEIIRIIKSMYKEIDSLKYLDRIRNLKLIRNELNINQKFKQNKINSDFIIYNLFRHKQYFLLDNFMLLFWKYRNK